MTTGNPGNDTNNTPDPNGTGGSNDSGTGGDGNTPAPEVVSKADHERALKDMHKFKAEKAALEEKLRLQETEGLKSKEQWKTLYEQEAEARKKSDEQIKFLTDSQINALKTAAVRAECIKLGLLDSAVDDLDMIDLSDIIVETTNTGKATVINAKTFAEMLKSKKPHWFGSRGAPNVNTSTPGVMNGGAITTKTLMELEAKAKKSGSAEDVKAYREAVIRFKMNSGARPTMSGGGSR